MNRDGGTERESTSDIETAREIQIDREGVKHRDKVIQIETERQERYR